ncbi:MAG: hypothetical protein WCI72_00310 [archaeon]
MANLDSERQELVNLWEKVGKKYTDQYKKGVLYFYYHNNMVTQGFYRDTDSLAESHPEVRDHENSGLIVELESGNASFFVEDDEFTLTEREKNLMRF